MRTLNDDEDDAFDEDGLLKDGHVGRVPLMMKDSWQRDMNEDFRSKNHPHVTDASGGTTGLHRPGYRVANTITRDQSHYDDYDAELEGAWKNIPPDPPARDAAPTRDTMTTREEAYRVYDQELSAAWRNLR
jgi:hypothetical protein